MISSPRIRILPDEIVNRVAAGEVVERPAAALKELLENAIDAGASNLTVDLVRAGRSMIRVVDDGCGMSRDDVLLALERHATSKIRDVGDLELVGTLGFRGEALPSIAAVSRTRIDTRERGAPDGTRVDVDGGRILRVSPCGCPEGTAVEIRDLFHTVPARRKFLRTDATEFGHCISQASRLALACPGVGLVVRHGGREHLRLSPSSSPGNRLREHFGREFHAGLVAARGGAGTLSLSGFVTRPGCGRAGADYQQFFVNHRPVRDSLLLGAVREASRDLYLQESSPVAFFLWLDLPPAEVDVNVHPTKREVRFRNPADIRTLVAGSVRAALLADGGATVLAAARSIASAPSGAVPDVHPSGSTAGEAPGPLYRTTSPSAPGLPFIHDTSCATTAAAFPGQLFGTYLLAVVPAGLAIVDQHAAHERILYEQLLSRPPGEGSQQLVEPLLLEVSPAEDAALAEVRSALSEAGVDLEPFGPRLWRVRALPPELPPSGVAEFVREFVDRSSEDGPSPAPVGEIRHRVASVVACHSAVRAGRLLAPSEAAALLADLARTDNPTVCPHGRPTTITLERAEIERRFRRG